MPVNLNDNEFEEAAMKIKVSRIIPYTLAFAVILSLSTLAASAQFTAASPDLPSGVGPNSNSSCDNPYGIYKNCVYVSPDGNDSTANGSIDAPYKSINAALSAAQPGDAVILRGGTYREGVNVRIRKPDIAIRSRQGEWAVIDLTTYNSGHDEDSGVYFDVNSSGGRLQSVEVIGGFYAVCMETKWDWGDPNDRAGASNIVIQDCILHDSRYDVVKVKPNCNNIVIQNNEIYNSGRAFDGRPHNGEDNAEGIDNVNGSRMAVRNNYIHDICSNAIYAKGGAADVVIENNRIERAYGAGIMVGFDASPEYFDITVNPKHYENIRCVVRNNLIVGTGWEGVGLYGSMDAQIYNNTLVNVVNGGQYHSAIYFGLTFQDWESYAGRPASVNPDIHHNIVCQPSGIVRPMIEIRYADELGGMSALDGAPSMSNNCYYIAGKRALFTDRRPDSILENAGLTEWQRHIGGDSGSVETDPDLGADYMPANPVCSGMGITSNLSKVASMRNFLKINTYAPGMFTDVNEDSWYGFNDQKVIASVFEYGLMKGKSETLFNPAGFITVAEAIAVAARVRGIYTTGADSFEEGAPWYRTYVDYAIDNEMIRPDEFSASDFNRAATRAEIAYFFARSVPLAEFFFRNDVSSLPDVDEDSLYHAEIFILYSAGVLTGSDDAGTFHPDSGVTRAEAAAIISRVILPSSRIYGKAYGGYV